MARESYTKQSWENKPSKKTPIRAEELLHIENGIYDNSENMALREIYGDENLVLSADSEISQRSVMNIVNGRDNSVAYGNNSIITGQENIFNGGEDNAITGRGNSVSGAENIVAGQGNNVTGQYLSVFGLDNVVGTGVTAVFGMGNRSKSGYQMVHGKYNVEDTKSIYAHIVGGGRSDTDRENIYMLDWEGNAVFAGDVTNGNGVSLDSLKTMLDDISGTAAEVTAMTYEETMTILNREETV